VIYIRCSHPTLCIWYGESETSNTPKRSVCLLKDMPINYTNIDKIENCQDHKTSKQLSEEWNKSSCN
jgi:hypothetical protein